jgi:hypothetical protein
MGKTQGTKTATAPKWKSKDTGSFSMWLCLPGGMYAIARRWAGSYDPQTDPRDIQVRARKAKYLDRLRKEFLPELGQDEGKAGQGTDYGHRAFVSSEDLARALARMALAVDASGFKDHCKDNDLHTVYHQIWNAAVRLDDNSPYNWKPEQRKPRPEDCVRFGEHFWSPTTGTGKCTDCGARRVYLPKSDSYRHTYPEGAVKLPAKAA